MLFRSGLGAIVASLTLCGFVSAKGDDEAAGFARAIGNAQIHWLDKYGTAPVEGDLVPVRLPAGAIRGVEIKDDGNWSPLSVVEPWWGDATLVISGSSSGTLIVPVHDDSGWGESLAVRGGDWAGRVWFTDLTIQASGSNAVELGYWGHQEEQPLRDIRFINCTFLDHPLESVRCVRPVSANQTSVTFIGCTWKMPNSVEHAVYTRNPYGVSGMLNCVVDGVGAQVWQEVNRPLEGPYYPGGKTVIANSRFENYHQDPSRSGSALTFSGGRDIAVIGNVILDVERPPGENSYGGFVSWDGGTYYSTSGEAVLPGEKADLGQYANGELEVTGNIFVQKKPDRSIFQVDSCERVVVRNNGFYGDRPVEVLDHVNGQGVPTDAGVGNLLWMNNNTAAHEALALELGIAPELLIEPILKVGGEIVGDASSTHSF